MADLPDQSGHGEAGRGSGFHRTGEDLRLWPVANDQRSDVVDLDQADISTLNYFG